MCLFTTPGALGPRRYGRIADKVVSATPPVQPPRVLANDRSTASEESMQAEYQGTIWRPLWGLFEKIISFGG